MARRPPAFDKLLSRLQRDSFAFFMKDEPTFRAGLFADSTEPDSHASTASMGFAMACCAVAAHTRFAPRDVAAAAARSTLRFLLASEQSLGPEASGYRGFYYHFLDRKTGRRAGQCELSSIDTALLVAGALVAALYFDGDDPVEQELRDMADRVYRRVEWDWMCNAHPTISMGWKPDEGYLPTHWRGYNEGLLLYLLALGSPTHPIEPAGFSESVRHYQWRRLYGLDHVYAGPLFIHQMPHCFVDFRGIRDDFMRRHDCDYFENSRRATYVHYRYAVANPRRLPHYGPTFWGITASDGPGPATRIVRGRRMHFYNYLARGAPFGPDDGSVSPWAAATSLPFAPEIVLPTLRRYVELGLDLDAYGFTATYNGSFRTVEDSRGWRSPRNYGINQGPVVMMIENHRSDLIWRLTRRAGPIVRGLQRAGFTGGWLDAAEVQHG